MPQGLVDMSDDNIVGVRMFDLHLGVVAATKTASGQVEAPKPLIYGTAFPILPGLFVTAGHSAKDAKADGLLGLVRLNSSGDVVVSAVTRCEVFDAIDLALMECPDFAGLTPFVLEFDRGLGLLDPAYAVGFPHAMDAEWVTVVPRGFRGYVVTRRELYQLSGRPRGYELSSTHLKVCRERRSSATFTATIAAMATSSSKPHLVAEKTGRSSALRSTFKSFCRSRPTY